MDIITAYMISDGLYIITVYTELGMLFIYLRYVLK